MILMRINLFPLKNYAETACRILLDLMSYNTVSQQNGDSIDDGIAPPAALAAQDRSLKFQGLVADGANNPAQILCL
jgi:hypothetical protein